MKIILVTIMALPFLLIFGVIPLDYYIQSNAYSNLRNSANFAVRSAALQVDYKKSAAGVLVLNEDVSKQVFKDVLRSFLDLDQNYHGGAYDSLDVKTYVVNYSPEDPLPRHVIVPGWEGEIRRSSIISVINFKKSRLIVGAEPIEAQIVSVEQAQLKPKT